MDSAVELTRHKFGVYSASSKGEGHPILYTFKEADVIAPFPEGGGYPKGFIARAYEALGVTAPEKVLHMCSGSIQTGITVDIRSEKNPSIVADVRNIPLPDSSVQWILADPPYTEEYARNLYGTEAVFPKPGEILREAARLLVEGGRIGLLHFVVPMNRHPLKFVAVYGITCGLGQQMRAFTVLEKRSDATFRNGR